MNSLLVVLLSGACSLTGATAQTAYKLSLNQFQNMLHSHATAEYTTEAQWQSALNSEWDLMSRWELEPRNRRLRLGEPKQKWPFIVCDTNQGKAGDKCKATIEHALETSDLLPVYNKADMTCFAVEACPTRVTPDALPLGLVAIPMTPEMKIAKGGTSLNQIQRLDVTFCPQQTVKKTSTDTLAAQLVQELKHSGRRSLRAKEFLNTRSNRTSHGNWTSVLTEPCQETIQSLSIEVSHHNGMTLTLPNGDVNTNGCLSAAMIDLATHPQVCFVNGYQRIKLRNDAASGIVQSGNTVDRPFHDTGIDGTGQVVAVSDTGVDLDNCYFFDPENPTPKDGRIYSNARKVIQYVAYADGQEVAKGHGTHVAGLLAGHRVGGGRGDGVATGAKLSIFDIGDASTSTMRVPDPWTMFGPAYKAGARVHSASWGTAFENGYTALDSAIDTYMYQNPDFLFVVAAGNEGQGDTPHTVGSPATTKNSLAVGASRGTAKTRETVTRFSSRGPTADGRMKPDVVAPGYNILSAGSVPDMQGECDENGGLVRMSGTSMAAPIVAGAAALVRQYFEDGWHYDGTEKPAFGYNPRASLVKAVILNGGDELTGLGADSSSAAYDEEQGFGRVNLQASLPLKDKNDIQGVFVNAQTISSLEEKVFKITVKGSDRCHQPLSATLVWTDPPVAPNCNQGCVLNDLDLFVTRSGSSNKIFPNGLNQADSTNNAERVRIENPVAGSTYSVHVAGTELIADQEFSLVITGCMSIADEKDRGVDDAATNPESTSGVSDCFEDDSAEFAFSDTETKTCSWLSKNLQHYDYLCVFTDISSICPSSCRNCPQVVNGEDAAIRSAELPFDGRVRWYGYRFVVDAKNDILLTGMDLHLNTRGSRRVRISIQQTETDSDDLWTLLLDADIESKGFGTKTSTENNHFEPFKMKRGNSYTVFVTSVESPELILTRLESKRLDAILETNDVVIQPGLAVTTGHSSLYDGFSFNGSLRYSLLEEQGCSDSVGMLFISERVGARSCAWLSENAGRFGYACRFADVAAFCPRTCNSCSSVDYPVL